MDAYAFVCWAFSALTLISATAVYLTANLVRAAYAFFLSLIGMAGIYALAGNDVLAAGQIVVYVGGILILLLFGVMLSARMWRGGAASVRPADRLWGAGVAAGVFAFLCRFVPPGDKHSLPSGEHLLLNVGTLNLTEYLPLFEGLSLLLLAALIGAATLARTHKNA
jgi:NADH-quinone oxidoreductase subunit J